MTDIDTNHIHHIYIYTVGSLMPPLVMTKLFNTMVSQSPWFIKPITQAIVSRVQSSYTGPTLKSAFDYCESELSRVTGEFWLGPQLTASDFMVSGTVLNYV